MKVEKKLHRKDKWWWGERQEGYLKKERGTENCRVNLIVVGGRGGEHIEGVKC